MRPLMIGVIGEGDPPPEVAAQAEEVGAEIGAAGAILICGGMGGVMEAACRGAQRRGGITIGILPTLRHTDANPYVTYPIPTGLGHARNIIVARCSHAIVAVGGKFGTLSEIAFAKIEGTPVVGLRSWRIDREGLEADPIIRATDAKEAIRLALEAAAGRAGKS